LEIVPFSGGIMPLAFGKPIAVSVMQAMLLRVWLRPFSRLEQVGKHSSVVCLTRTPSCSCRVDWCSGRCLARSIYPEERPTHRVAMSGFWMDSHPVTNAEFRRFVKAAGHVTLAERPPNGADYPPYPASLDELRAAGMPAVVELQLWTGRDRQTMSLTGGTTGTATINTGRRQHQQPRP
jgi:hypothetical protein